MRAFVPDCVLLFVVLYNLSYIILSFLFCSIVFNVSDEFGAAPTD